MKFIPFLFFLGLSGHLFAQTSYVPPTKILSKKGYQLGVSADYFQSSKKVDKDKEKFSYESGESFSRLQSDVFGNFGLTENLQLGGGIRFRQNQSKLNDPTTNETESETSSGVESTYATFMYAFKPVERLQYTLEGLFRFRPFTNEEATATSNGNLILGDDGNEYAAGLGVTYGALGLNYLTGRVGYRKPGQDLSSEIYWQLEGALTWKYFALIAGVDGITSLSNDPYESNPTGKPVYNTGNTELYSSTNRDLIAPYVGMNFALGQKWRLELKGSQVVSGKSTDLGTAFGISLITRVDKNNNAKIDRKFKDYDFEATITKVSPKKEYVIIDKGLSQNVEKGLKIDFYEFDYVGGNILIASGIVLQSKSEIAVVKITQRYNAKKELKEGIIARGSFK